MLAAGEFTSHFSSDDGNGTTRAGDVLFGLNPDIICLQ
jgi:hypothetical protein